MKHRVSIIVFNELLLHDAMRKITLLFLHNILLHTGYCQHQHFTISIITGAVTGYVDKVCFLAAAIPHMSSGVSRHTLFLHQTVAITQYENREKCRVCQIT